MYCKGCGARAKQTARFCFHCGARLKSEATAPKLTIEKAGREKQVKRQDKISFFTNIAYTIRSSKNKYRSMFLILAIFVVGIAFLTVICPGIVGTISEALQLSDISSAGHTMVSLRQSEAVWRNVWCSLFLIAGSVVACIGAIMTGIELIKLRYKQEVKRPGCRDNKRKF